MVDIKPIETQYKGYRFRSRLEAKWAVFFDSLGIKWEFEKEGFDLGGGLRYLPDFWLETVHMWAEVKHKELTGIELSKVVALANQSKVPVLLLVGHPEDKSYNVCEIDGSITSCCLSLDHYAHRFFWWPSDADLHQEDTLRAINAARAARFEFGENGTTPPTTKALDIQWTYGKKRRHINLGWQPTKK